MDANDKEVQDAVELLDRLLETADGGRGVSMGEYEASTMLALLMDKEYRRTTLSQLSNFDEIDHG